MNLKFWSNREAIFIVAQALYRFYEERPINISSQIQKHGRNMHNCETLHWAKRTCARFGLWIMRCIYLSKQGLDIEGIDVWSEEDWADQKTLMPWMGQELPGLM